MAAPIEGDAATTAASKQPRGARWGPASFALVSEELAIPQAGTGIELLLSGGRRLRISRGVDQETLRRVLAAVEHEEC